MSRRIEARQLVEVREPLSENEALFIAGMFEVSGMVTLATSSQPKRAPHYRYVYPLFSYSDNRRAKIEALKRTFGGMIISESATSSYRWSLKYKEAVEVARAILPFAPSRTEALLAIVNWSETDDIDERIQIAYDLRISEKVPLRSEEYDGLIDNPAFLAGVIEARGLITGNHLAIVTTNRALLESLRNHRGGGIASKGISQTYTLGATKAIPLINFCAPYFVLPAK